MKERELASNKKMLLANSDLCTGCGRCELACSYEHSNKFSRTESRIHVLTRDVEEFILILCFQCENAPCAKACNVGAIRKDSETNALIIDADKCIGCKACVTVCPYGGISLNSKGKITKCDYCEGDPKCLLFCVPKALIWKTPNEFSASDRKALAQREARARAESRQRLQRF